MKVFINKKFPAFVSVTRFLRAPKVFFVIGVFLCIAVGALYAQVHYATSIGESYTGGTSISLFSSDNNQEGCIEQHGGGGNPACDARVLNRCIAACQAGNGGSGYQACDFNTHDTFGGDPDSDFAQGDRVSWDCNAVAGSYSGPTYTPAHYWYTRDTGTGNPGPGGFDRYMALSPAPVPVSLTTNPSTIDKGSSSVLSWNASNATVCTIDQGVGNVAPTSGTKSVAPASTTMYTITCSGPGGTGTSSSTVTVNDSGAGGGTPIAKIWTDDPVIQAGGQTRMNWSCSFSAASATGTMAPVIGPDGNQSTSVFVGGPNVIHSALTGHLMGTRTYTFTCTDSNGKSSSANARVLVTKPPVPLSASCGVSPQRVTVGDTVTWTVSASGGNSSYTYAWSGTDGLAGANAIVQKSYDTAGTKSASVNVVSGAEQVTKACLTSVTVVDPSTQPNLTAGSTMLPTTGIAGQSIPLSAAITNKGLVTATNFGNIFQVKGGALISGSSIAILEGNATKNTTGSAVFGRAGTYSVRACADNSVTSGGDWGGGTVAESNEQDNCGDYTDIVITTATALPPLSCTPLNSNIAPGASVTFTVSPSNAGPYTWSPSEISGRALPQTGSSVSRTYKASGNYSMDVVATGYAPGTCNILVSGPGGGKCSNPSVTLTSAVDRVKQGDSTTLTVNASGINNSCVITRTGGAILKTLSAAACNLPSTAISSGPIETQTVFTANCDNGRATASVVVNVIPAFQEF